MYRPTRRSGLPCLAMMAALAALSACNGNPDETAVQCPGGYRLPDAQTLSRYRGTSHDLSDLIFTARLLDAPGACIGALGTKQEGVRVHVLIAVTRGPASPGTAVDIPYGIGVMRQGRVEDVHRYVQHVEFPANVNTVEVTGPDVKMTLPTGKGIGANSYHLYFWLQLTPEELAANRRNG